MHDFQGFEKYRRDRNKRRMEDGPLRPMGQNAAILREIEEADAQEARNQRLTREVHEFFAEATRTAATIVSQVTENAEQELQEGVATEMSDFLAETIRRAQMFVELALSSTPPGVAQQDLQANMHNIVGRTLDEFRFAGDVTTAEAHVGQDPFATEVTTSGTTEETDESEVAPQGTVDEAEMTEVTEDAPVATTFSEPARIEDHLVAEVLGVEDDHDDGSSPEDALWSWLDRVHGDEETCRTILKALVRADVMTKGEARAIYRTR